MYGPHHYAAPDPSAIGGQARVRSHSRSSAFAPKRPLHLSGLRPGRGHGLGRGGQPPGLAPPAPRAPPRGTAPAGPAPAPPPPARGGATHFSPPPRLAGC